MKEKSLHVAYILGLLGGVIDLVLAINLISPLTNKQLLAAYYGVIGAAVLAFSFRLKRPHHRRGAAIVLFVLSLFSAPLIVLAPTLGFSSGVLITTLLFAAPGSIMLGSIIGLIHLIMYREN